MYFLDVKNQGNGKGIGALRDNGNFALEILLL
jgi:hypothetical protein